VSILAVMKAGGCYLPCDPSYPDDRLAVYLEDAKAAMMMVQAAHVQRAETLVAGSVPIVDVAEPISKDTSALVKSPGAEDPAYIIFTSGSTGRPKGVVIPHRALRDHALGTRELYGIKPDDASLLTITINFDPHIMQIFPHLTVGGRVVIARPDGHTDGDYVSSIIAQEGVTHFTTTPSLALVQFGTATAADCTKLRYVMVGGEAMVSELIQMFVNKVSSSIVGWFDSSKSM